MKRDVFLSDKGWIDVEVIPGASFGLERPSSNHTDPPDQLRLHVPDDSKLYTVRDLVSLLSANYEKLGNLILNGKPGRLKGNAVIVLNGRHIDLQSGLDTPLRAGDPLELIPVISGG